MYFTWSSVTLSHTSCLKFVDVKQILFMDIFMLVLACCTFFYLIFLECPPNFFDELTTNVPSYKSYSVDLLCQSANWFLYEKNIGC